MSSDQSSDGASVGKEVCRPCFSDLLVGREAGSLQSALKPALAESNARIRRGASWKRRMFGRVLAVFIQLIISLLHDRPGESRGGGKPRLSCDSPKQNSWSHAGSCQSLEPFIVMIILSYGSLQATNGRAHK